MPNSGPFRLSTFAVCRCYQLTNCSRSAMEGHGQIRESLALPHLTHLIFFVGELFPNCSLFKLANEFHVPRMDIMDDGQYGRWPFRFLRE